MSKNPKKAIGNNIRKRRLAANWSQEELADKSGLHRTYVGAVERGERNVSIENIVAIARALNISASELLEGVK